MTCTAHGTGCAFPDADQAVDICPTCHVLWSKIEAPAFFDTTKKSWSKPKDGSEPQRVEYRERHHLPGYGETREQHLKKHAPAVKKEPSEATTEA